MNETAPKRAVAGALRLRSLSAPSTARSQMVTARLWTGTAVRKKTNVKTVCALGGAQRGTIHTSAHIRSKFE